MPAKTLPFIAILGFFLVGVPIIISAMISLGIDRGAITDFISFCASLVGVSRVGSASTASEIMLTIAFIGGVMVTILYIYERVFGEERS